MNPYEILIKLGYEAKEAAVYVAGLELGPATVKALSIKSKVKRTTLYQILESLKEKGLFTETVKGKKHLFVAVHPNRLKVLLNEKQEILERNISALIDATNTLSGKPVVQYYDSREGIQKMYEDALEHITTDTLGISGADATEEFTADWLQKYINKRIKKGIAARTILTDSAATEAWKKKDEVQKRTTKALAHTKKIPVNIEVVGNRVLISSLVGEELGLSIESARVAESMKEILEIVWESLD